MIRNLPAVYSDVLGTITLGGVGVSEDNLFQIRDNFITVIYFCHASDMFTRKIKIKKEVYVWW